MKEKMYLQVDNAGYGILITDGKEHWYYWSETEISININRYDEDNKLSDKANIKIIREAINNDELYNASDFIHETENIEEHLIKEYEGMSIEDIERFENNKNTRNCELTYWIEI